MDDSERALHLRGTVGLSVCRRQTDVGSLMPMVLRAVFRTILIAVLALPAVAGAQDSVSNRPLSMLETIEAEMRQIVQTVSPSVVTIRATRSAETQTRDMDPREAAMSVGSGIILDTNGYIMTSSSVIAGADDFWIETYDERLFQAVLIGASDEIAVLQVKGSDFKVPMFGESIDLGVGSFVVALGNSYGYSCGAAWGEVNGFRPDGSIQLALGVSPGNTGGAVVNSHGRIVGMIKAKISEPFYLDPMYCRTGEEKTPVRVPGRRLELPTSPVSLATPIQTVLREARRVLAAGTEPRAYVGVYVEDLTGWYVMHFKTKDGVLVTGVVARTPAERSGLLQADVITAVDRQSVNSVRQFRQIVGQATPGQRLQFDIIRGGKPLKLTVEAGRAETPHLSATDGAAQPFSSRVQKDEESVAGLTPPSRGKAAVVEELAIEPTQPAEAMTVPSEHDWMCLIDSMRLTIDSLKQEVLTLKQQMQP